MPFPVASWKTKASCIELIPCHAWVRDFSVSGTHHTVRTTIEYNAALFPLFEERFVVNSAMHIDIHTFSKAMLQDSDPSARWRDYRVSRALTAASIRLGR